VIGRRVYALGGNQKAAKLSGVNTERLTLYTFINMGSLGRDGGSDHHSPAQLCHGKAGHRL
jgi:putative multiple sugar transport system permease protein